MARADAVAAGEFDLETPLSRWFQPGQEAARTSVSGWL